jgi:hypothetical protein
MFFGKAVDQSCPWGPVFQFKTDPEYAHHVFLSTLETRAPRRISTLHTMSVCVIFIEPLQICCHLNGKQECSTSMMKEQKHSLLSLTTYVAILFGIASLTSMTIQCPSFQLLISQTTSMY